MCFIKSGVKVADDFGRQYALAVPHYESLGIDGPFIGEQVWTYLERYHGEFEKLIVTIKRFGDGGDRVRIEGSPQDKIVFFPHFYYANSAAEHSLIGAQIADALQRADASHVYMIESYNPYYRQDARTPGKREAITARIVADLYVNTGVDRNYVIDPHFRQLEGFYPSRSAMKPLDLTEKFTGHLLRNHREQIAKSNLVGCAADDGGVRLTKRIMKTLDKEHHTENEARFIIRIDKDRLEDAEDKSRANAVLGDVKGQNIIVREDVMGTGQTIENTVRITRKAGAEEIMVVSTYVGRIPEERMKYFRGEGIKIVTTDGIPSDISDKFSVMRLAPLVNKIITKKIRRQSLSDYMAELDV